MAFSLIQASLLAAVLGVGLHLGYFIRGEHHRSNLRILNTALFGPLVLILYLYRGKALSLSDSIKAAYIISGAFVGSLTASILTYRFFFHRLRGYPGPPAARLSKFWQVKKTLFQYNAFQLLDEVHAQYGDYVRTGPNEVSVIDPDIVDLVHGPQSKCIKNQWYDQSLPITSLQQFRDKALHDKRRRGGWDKAFNTKSLRSYDGAVIALTDALLQKLDSFTGRPVNSSEWFNYYSYDVMGSLGFGKSFDTLKTGGSHKFIDILRSGLLLLKFFGSVAYLNNLLAKIPGPIMELNIYSDKCVQERRQKKAADPDILGHLIEFEEFFGDKELDHALLLGDSRLVIVAGSDTTAAALTYTFHYIAKDPSIADKIRAELRENNIQNDETFSIQALQNLSYLNGVVNEGLRLHPPVPGGTYRITPPEGIKVGDHFIPGGVNVLTPQYSIQRSAKSFVNPNSFIPERWNTKPELILHKSAYFPFSVGPYGCIGKQLALGEIRTVISKILLEFDVRLASTETETELISKQRDNFTLHPGESRLCFVRRDQQLN